MTDANELERLRLAHTAQARQITALRAQLADIDAAQQALAAMTREAEAQRERAESAERTAFDERARGDELARQLAGSRFAPLRRLGLRRPRPRS